MKLINLAPMLLLAAVGCGGEPIATPGPQSLEEMVADALRARGIDFKELRVDRDAWQATVDRDLIFRLEVLLGPHDVVVTDDQLTKHPQGYSTECNNTRGVFACSLGP